MHDVPLVGRNEKSYIIDMKLMLYKDLQMTVCSRTWRRFVRGSSIKTTKIIRVGVYLLLSLIAFSAWGSDSPDDCAQSFPDYPGYEKMIYKRIPDNAGGMWELPVYVKKPIGWKFSDKRGALIFNYHATTKENDQLQSLDYYASRGLVAMHIGKRNSKQNRDLIADTRSAVRWVRGHAGELGVDPDHIAMGGVSMGAYLSACTGTIPSSAFDEDPQDDLKVSCRPNVLLLYYPVLIDWRRSENSGHKGDLTPAHFVDAETPPTLYMAGEIDEHLPSDGFKWRDLMAKAGAPPCEFIILRGIANEKLLRIITSPTANDIVRQSDLFLARHGFLSGPPTLVDISGGKELHVPPAEWKPNKAQEATIAKYGCR